MAEIDKALPNTKDDEFKETEVVTPENEIEIGERVEETEGPEIIETEDGGAEISFDPTAMGAMESKSHFENLADLLDDEILDPIGSKMTSDYLDYRQSRKDWEDTYKNGLDLLGFKYEKRTEPFRPIY